MVTGIQIARAGPVYLGTPYDKMDCQAFVERCLSDCGIRKDLKGSNAWYRFLRQHGWTGSPKECVKTFGSIPVGAFLIVHKFDGGEEARGYHDGLGNASHIGIYTEMSGQEMASLAVSEGNDRAGNYIFGDGAIASSSTRKHVATSKFAGKAISGGWNVIGLWPEISYGERVDSILRGGAAPDPDQGGKNMTGIVTADSGSTVNLRLGPSMKYELAGRIRIGETVDVVTKGDDWCKIVGVDEDGRRCVGYMKTEFLRFDADPQQTTGMVQVPREELLNVYTKIGEFLGIHG